MTSDANLVINTLAIILFGGIFAGKWAERHGLPKMIPMIIFGMILAILDSSTLVDFTNESTQEIGLVITELALVIILYNEGMHLNLNQLKKYFKIIIILAVFGTIITVLLVSLILTTITKIVLDREIVGLGLLLVAAIVAPTDPAATFSALKRSGLNVKKKFEVILGGESAFNDVIAILLVIILFLPQVADGNTSINLEIGVLFALFR